jgi:hypothetical protein
MPCVTALLKRRTRKGTRWAEKNFATLEHFFHVARVANSRGLLAQANI